MGTRRFKLRILRISLAMEGILESDLAQLRIMLGDELKALEILCSPARILEHGPEGARREGLAGAVIVDGHTPPVRMEKDETCPGAAG